MVPFTSTHNGTSPTEPPSTPNLIQPTIQQANVSRPRLAFLTLIPHIKYITHVLTPSQEQPPSSIIPKIDLKSLIMHNLVNPLTPQFLAYFFALERKPVQSSAQLELPSKSRKLSFQFGAVADVQYADRPVQRSVTTIVQDKKEYFVRRRRAWREAIPKLQEAIHAFDKAQVDFVINLGDLIEGNGTQRQKENLYDLNLVTEKLNQSTRKIHHVIGNHCRCIPLRKLQKILSMDKPFYSFSPASGWRSIILHSAELSGSAVDMTEKQSDLLSDIIENEQRRKHHFHGALASDQLTWLEKELDEATKLNEHVLVFSHYPLSDGSARESHVLANTKVVTKILERKGSPVVACFAGHDHMGGIFVSPSSEETKSVSYITLPGILEAPANGNAYALITAYDDGCIAVEGVGTVQSCVVEP